MGFFSRNKDKNNQPTNNNQKSAPVAMPTPINSPAQPPRPPMGPGPQIPNNPPRPPMGPNASGPMGPKPPMPLPPGAPTPNTLRPPMGPTPPMAPGAGFGPNASASSAPSFNAPRPPMGPTSTNPSFGSTTPSFGSNNPSFGPSNPSTPGFNSQTPSFNNHQSFSAPNTQGFSQPPVNQGNNSSPYKGNIVQGIGGGNRQTVYDMNDNNPTVIWEIDLESGRVPKETFTSSSDVNMVKAYINRLTIRKQELLAIEEQLLNKKAQIEAKMPKKKTKSTSSSSTTKSKALVPSKAKSSKKATPTKVEKVETKKPDLDKNAKISKTQKHQVVKEKMFTDDNGYNLEIRKKQWKKWAGHNDPQVVCDICKDDDNWASILLDNNKHICYYCWIKKPSTLMKELNEKKNATKLVPTKATPSQKTAPKKVASKKPVKNAKTRLTGAGKDLENYLNSSKTKTQIKKSKVSSSVKSKSSTKKSTKAKKAKSKK